LIASLAKLAQLGSRSVAAYFVVPRGRRTCPLPPPQTRRRAIRVDCFARQARAARIALCCAIRCPAAYLAGAHFVPNCFARWRSLRADQ